MKDSLDNLNDSGSLDQQKLRSNMKVAIYARVSTSDQRLDTQLLLLREFCQNFQDVKEYTETASGKDDRRLEFNRLLNDVRADKINCVVVYKLDRIGRSLKHLISLLEEFASKKVEFISITQNINTTTPEGKLFLNMLCVFAQYERELIVARTISGLERARKEGKVLGRPAGRRDKKPRKTSGYVKRWKWREKQ